MDKLTHIDGLTGEEEMLAIKEVKKSAEEAVALKSIEYMELLGIELTDRQKIRLKRWLSRDYLMAFLSGQIKVLSRKS